MCIRDRYYVRVISLVRPTPLISEIQFKCSIWCRIVPNSQYNIHMYSPFSYFLHLTSSKKWLIMPWIFKLFPTNSWSIYCQTNTKTPRWLKISNFSLWMMKTCKIKIISIVVPSLSETQNFSTQLVFWCIFQDVYKRQVQCSVASPQHNRKNLRY